MRFDRVDKLSFAVTALVAGFIYWFTLPPEITLRNAGTMATGAMYAGVPHPPGYPAWVLYAWLFVKLVPFSNVAWRVALSSAIAAAAAGGLVALMVSYAGKVFFNDRARCALNLNQRKWLRIVSGWVGGMALALSGGVWRNAVLADFWAFSLLLFTGVLCLLTRWWCEPRRRFLAAAFFLLGLLLTSSQELLIVFPGFAGAVMLGHPRSGRDLVLFVTPLIALTTSRNQYNLWQGDFQAGLSLFSNWPLVLGFGSVGIAAAAVVIATRRVGTEWKLSLACALCLVSGLAFYLYPPIASMSNPPVNWCYARNAEGFFHLIGRGHYEHPRVTQDFGRMVAGLWSFARMAGGDIGRMASGEFGCAYLPFVALSFGFFGRLNRPGRRWMLGLLLVFLCVAPLLLAQLDPDPNGGIELARSYFAPAFAVLAVWTGLGLMLLLSKFRGDDASAGDLL